MTKVYHANTRDDRDFRLNIDFARGEKLVEIVKANLDKYTLVALPETKTLNDAYRITNSVDYAWFEDAEACPTLEAVKGCRSTSIGDLIVMDSITYVVDSYGFTEVF